MYLNKLIPTQGQASDQTLIYKRMRAAIERIEAAFDPNLDYDMEKRKTVASIALIDSSSITAWERGWMALIDHAKRATKVAYRKDAV